MAAYNPGTPTAAKQIGPNEFIVDSFTGESRSYRVTLGERPSCSCPHWQLRLAEGGGKCKHLVACEQQASWIAAAEKARKLSDEQLLLCLQKHGLDPVVGGAIRAERQRRKQQAEQQAKYREMFG